MFIFPRSEFLDDEFFGIVIRKKEDTKHHVECESTVVTKEKTVHGVELQEYPADQNFQRKPNAVDDIYPLETDDVLDPRLARHLGPALEEDLDVDSSGDEKHGDNHLAYDPRLGQVHIPVL